MQSEELFGFYYNIGDMNLGAHHLYMLYDEVLKTEGIDKREWKEAAQEMYLVCSKYDRRGWFSWP